jgi:GrpB-like predicted nucleotidyltransferase (UPF0157 family)
MADQLIALVQHDPSWHDRFLAQQAALSRLLRPWLTAPPEHVGSTAIAGLRAKPIVDVLAPVHSLAEAQDAVPVLERDGWLFWADDPNRSYRLWFLRPTPTARTHHLYLMQHDHTELRNVLLFRDALRNDPALRREYAALKDRLAVQHAADRDAYTDAKSDFVRSVLKAAGAAPSSRRSLA